MGMCGPLSNLFAAGSSVPCLLAYHGLRILVYGLAGALAGLLAWPLAGFIPTSFLALPLIFFLLMYAAGFQSPVSEGFSKIYRRLTRPMAKLAPFKRALLLGMLTPLLPCGLFYGALAGTLSAPGPFEGAFWMMAFAGGTIPLLVVGQKGLVLICGTLAPAQAGVLMRGSAVVTAVFIGWMSFK